MERKRIFTAIFRSSSNSFNPLLENGDSFSLTEGEDIRKNYPVLDELEAQGFETVPSVMALSPAGGALQYPFYDSVVQKVLSALQAAGKVDGVFLHLQGAQRVVGIGSGEAFLVSRIRDTVGWQTPIAVVLDYHANITCTLAASANLLLGYRTNPHTDVLDTARRGAALLGRMVREGLLPRMRMVRLPLLLADSTLTARGSGHAACVLAEKLERREEVFSATFFAGSAWEDIPNAGATLAVCALEENHGLESAVKQAAAEIWQQRNDFVFESDRLEPAQAICRAQSVAKGLVFITDSGDNVTNGAVGDNAYMLDCVIKSGAHRVLITPICDERAVKACAETGSGRNVTVTIGGQNDSNSRQVTVTGRVKHLKRDRLGYVTGCVLALENEVDVMLSKERQGITKPEEIEDYNVYLGAYQMIVIKLGYLLECFMQYAADYMMALSPGNTMLDLGQLPYRRLRRPIAPLDAVEDFEPVYEKY